MPKLRGKEFQDNCIAWAKTPSLPFGIKPHSITFSPIFPKDNDFMGLYY